MGISIKGNFNKFIKLGMKNISIDPKIWPTYVVEFDGNDGVMETRKQINFSTSKWTVESWIKLLSDNDYTHVISAKNDQSNASFKIGDGGFNRIPYFYSGSSTYEANKSLNLNEWYHLAYVYDGSNVKIYINGNLDLNSSANINISEDYFIVQKSNVGEFNNVRQSDLRVWMGTYRTQEEINNYMDVRLKGNEEKLLHYWPMDEGSESTVNDKANDNNCDLFNGFSWKYVDSFV